MFLRTYAEVIIICILATPRLKFDGGTCHWNVGNFIPSKLHLRHSRLTLGIRLILARVTVVKEEAVFIQQCLFRVTSC